MSGIWYATAILLGRIFAIAATAGALFSVASEIGPLSLAEPEKTSQPQLLSSRRPNRQQADTEVAPSNYQQAITLARQAVDAYQSAQQTTDQNAKLTFTRRERSLWQASLQKLSEISISDADYQQAVKKQEQYRALLATADGKVVASDNAFLKTLIIESGVAPEQVHITLCQIDISATAQPLTEQPNSNGCRHHQGDAQLASAASLIKLPIAIALMDKLEREGKSLIDKLYIDPSNFTENAEGIGIEVDQEYNLAQVMTRMINESNNIATNQLIDYIGREDMAKTMEARGYTDTLIDFKLAGDRILPSNPGTQSNQLTSNDLTAMMVQIYGLENPGDEDLLTALISQRDRELGHTALTGMTDVSWIGEKTGQNDRLIGSTLAMKVGTHRYALTVAIDNSGDVHALRDIIRGIAKHLIETGPITGEAENKTAESKTGNTKDN